MNRSRIEYCDHTLNIITGCLNTCEYCYARKMSQRFSGNVNLNMKEKSKYSEHDGLFVLENPFTGENDKQIIYPFGFMPTLHRYRFSILDKLKSGQNIFVGAMADMFGDWVPDEWINEVFQNCMEHKQHNYLFLTKIRRDMQILRCFRREKICFTVRRSPEKKKCIGSISFLLLEIYM